MITPRTTLALLTAIMIALGISWWRRDASVVPASANASLARESAKPSTTNTTTPPGSRPAAAPNGPPSTAGTASRDRATPGQILARLTALKVSANQPRSVRELLVELEALRQLGPAALPALREFLANGQDADYDAAAGKVTLRDGKVPADFIVPPSLRLALLEVAKNIGGAAAEDLLVRELKATGRGVEAGYIASALEQIAPGKYSDVALVDRRIALIDRLAPGGARHPIMAAAFAEARKDLIAMREKSRQPAPAPKP